MSPSIAYSSGGPSLSISRRFTNGSKPKPFWIGCPRRMRGSWRASAWIEAWNANSWIWAWPSAARGNGPEAGPDLLRRPGREHGVAARRLVRTVEPEPGRERGLDLCDQLAAGQRL